ncbi:hypothetical protein EDB85DRAFT_2152768 [Lactarius pseudohatsudake]|nr:hypothetical protein EDB85DRAFT_2152768 [Lactarius pseudohatsudake]
MSKTPQLPPRDNQGRFSSKPAPPPNFLITPPPSTCAPTKISADNVSAFASSSHLPIVSESLTDLEPNLLDSFSGSIDTSLSSFTSLRSASPKSDSDKSESKSESSGQLTPTDESPQLPDLDPTPRRSQRNRSYSTSHLSHHPSIPAPFPDLFPLTPAPPPTPSTTPHTMATTGIAGMLGPHSIKALFFAAKANDSLADFLLEYDILADTNNLTNFEKIETVTCYAPSDIHFLWSGLDSFSSGSWTTFQRKIKGLYPNNSAASQYTKKALEEFIDASALKCMWNKDDVIAYHCCFLEMSNHLFNSKCLSDND